ncbi:MAG: hypothetical protein GF398_08460 [Chitinivibrionales bacterium]|nr:hypothetical protein [Chitinivibrionales bacterium]
MPLNRFNFLHIFILSALIAVSAEYFPFADGYRWQFAFDRSVTGLMGSTTDSGLVEWEIVAVEVMESYPVQYRIRILQTRRTLRRYGASFAGTTGMQSYDSLVVPPLVSYDTVIVRSVGGVNGLWFEGDSCWSFVHNPNDSIPPNALTLTTGTISFRGQTLKTLSVDPAPCRGPTVGAGRPYLNCRAPSKFTLGENLGPVAYYSASSPCLMDYNLVEKWELVSTNVSGVGEPCVYDSVKDAATILSIAPSGRRDNEFDIQFSFGAEKRLYTFDMVEQASRMKSELFVKSGHRYNAWKKTTASAKCTQTTFRFEIPADWDDYDTSHTWIEPSGVAAGDPAEVHLLSYAFACNHLFSSDSAWTEAKEIILGYKMMTTRMYCTPSAGLFGHTFSLDALYAGAWPVYEKPYPLCHPACDIAVVPKLIDTLHVFGPVASIGAQPADKLKSEKRTTAQFEGARVRITLWAARPGLIDISGYDARGRLLLAKQLMVENSGYHSFLIDRMDQSTAPGTGVVFFIAGNGPNSQIVSAINR